MTREELIEVMARAIAQHQGEEWQGDMPAALQSREWSNVEDNLLGMAQAALAAIEAAGVRLVPVGEARAQLIDGDERTTVTIFTPYASPGG